MSGKVNQFFGAISVSLASLIFGIINTWPSYTLKVFEGENSPLLQNLTTTDISLLGSLPSIGALLTTPLGAMLMDLFGKKKGGILIGMLYTISWVMIGASPFKHLVLFSRFIAGLAGGTTSVLSPAFIAEIAEDSIRGTLGSVPIVSYTLGLMLSYTMGWVFGYRTIIVINVSICIVFTISMTLVKETPVYNLRKGKDKESLKSLAFYRGLPLHSKALAEEMRSMKNQQQAPEEMMKVAYSDGRLVDQEKQNLQPFIHASNHPIKELTGWRFLSKSATSRRALLICILMAGMSIFMGMLAVQVFAGKLFSIAAPNISSDLCSVLLAITLLLGSIASASLSDTAGRRVLMLYSSVAAAVCMGTLGSLVRWSWGPEWLIPVVILVFCFVFNAGAGTVPFVLIAEYFVPEVKSFAASLVMCTVWALAFVTLAMFAPAIQLIGIDGVFFFFSACSTATAVIAYFILPETKGLSCSAIQELFVRKN